MGSPTLFTSSAPPTPKATFTTLTYRSSSQTSPIKHMISITLNSPNPTHQTLHESCSNTVYSQHKSHPKMQQNQKYKNSEIKTLSLSTSLHLSLFKRREREKQRSRAESSFPSTIEHTAPETISTPSERAVARVYTCIACRSAHPRSGCVCVCVYERCLLSLGERERETRTHTHSTHHVSMLFIHTQTRYTQQRLLRIDTHKGK